MTSPARTARRPLALPLLASLVVACSATAPGAHPSTEAHGGSAPLTWTTQLERDHPLVGRIWDVRAQRFVSERDLQAALTTVRLVAIGEKHDNADHHLLQARVLDHLVGTGKRPAVVLEMLDVSDADALAHARAEHPHDVDAIATAVEWERSGWPAWSLYRPLFEVAVRAELPLVPAGLERARVMELARDGAAAVLGAELTQDYGLDQPLSAEAEAPLRQEMRAVHCGMLPDAALPPMVLVQRARDALLAERWHAAAAEHGGTSVLIAGNGHVRADRGAPAQLARVRGEPVLTIGVLEVDAEHDEPSDYAAGFGVAALPFDYVWLTPRASDEDPCAPLRSRHGGAAQAPAP